jgi:hypothetical protein
VRLEVDSSRANGNGRPRHTGANLHSNGRTRHTGGHFQFPAPGDPAPLSLRVSGAAHVCVPDPELFVQDLRVDYRLAHQQVSDRPRG